MASGILKTSVLGALLAVVVSGCSTSAGGGSAADESNSLCSARGDIDLARCTAEYGEQACDHYPLLVCRANRDCSTLSGNDTKRVCRQWRDSLRPLAERISAVESFDYAVDAAQELDSRRPGRTGSVRNTGADILRAVIGEEVTVDATQRRADCLLAARVRDDLALIMLDYVGKGTPYSNFANLTQGLIDEAEDVSQDFCFGSASPSLGR